MMTGNK